MSYFFFLGWFVVFPTLLLAMLAWRDQRRGRSLPQSLRNWPFPVVVAAHVLVAVLYTTPWDNYLVATGVWWYEPTLVTGIVLGWVPIEEYTFFVVQTVFTSLWLLLGAHRLAPPDNERPISPGLSEDKGKKRGHRLRLFSALVVVLLWVMALWLLLSGWAPGTYLALELAWALPPIIFQLGFGADILWRYRRIILWGLLPTTVYLAAVDTIAIGAGTWTIDPRQSTGLLIGHLPIEEFVFFLVTNTLVVFGMVLVLARASVERVPSRWRAQFMNKNHAHAQQSPAIARANVTHVTIGNLATGEQAGGESAARTPYK